MTTFSERVKIFVLIFWLLCSAAYVGTMNWRDKRRAERILSHAKFYLHATTSTMPLATRARDWAAMKLLTEKILEVRNG